MSNKAKQEVVTLNVNVVIKTLDVKHIVNRNRILCCQHICFSNNIHLLKQERHTPLSGNTYYVKN